MLPAVSANYDTILVKTWAGIKKRMVDGYDIPLVHRPRSEEPDDAVSEGVGYGMLLALYCNDQTYFNKIWGAGEQYMWDDNGKCYNWRVTRDGTVIGSGPASDAEQDIALALIFADALVKKGTWQPFTSPKGADYATRAQSIINSFWGNLIEEGKYLRPGAQWGGKAFVNPGYFAPAFYRVFDEFEQEDHNWDAVIDQCYQIVSVSPGYSLGLVPDWMQPDGNFAGEDQLGYNAYAGGKYMYKDAIRTLWRLATDYLWYGEPRAKKYCDQAFAFIKEPARANFFQMDGSAVDETFELGNGATRPRTEHSQLTVSMWATAVMAAAGADGCDPFSEELLSFYTPGADFWGRPTDANGEDTLHNEMYFEQFLAWFGASLISGVFTNLWEDFKDSTPEVAVAFVGTPKAEPFDVDASKQPLEISARFTKSARWTVSMQHRTIDSASLQWTGSDTAIAIQWSGTSPAGGTMPQGAYDITITARGIKEPFQTVAWLGRARDLKTGSRLIIDDFEDGDLRPYFGLSWGYYTEKDDGKNGLTSTKRFEVIQEGGKPALVWGFRLDGSQQIGFNPYGALQWSCASGEGEFSLTGLDTLIFSAKAASQLKVSVQFITSDIGDYTFFEDSVTLETSMKEFRLPVSEFRQRLNGSGRELDLSKCTAIRFQVQDVDGTENEIILQQMLVSGSPASQYTSPPAYIPPEPDIGIKTTCRGRTGMLQYVPSERSVLFNLSSAENPKVLNIFSVSGCHVASLSLSKEGQAVWHYTDSRGNRVRPGIYCAVIGPAGSRISRTLYCR